jgi:hypothetical protein
MAQTLKSQEQTSFSSYCSKACVVMYSNKRDLVSSMSEATHLMFIHGCYFVKNWKTPALLFAGVKKERDLLVRKGKTAGAFHGQTWVVAPLGACADHKPIFCSRVSVEVPGAVRGGLLHARNTTGLLKTAGKTLYCYTQTGNGNHLKSRMTNKDTARMLAGWVVATRYLARNLVYVHLSYPYQKLFPSLWTVWTG